METTNEGFNEDLQPITKRKPGTIDEIVARLDKAYQKGWVEYQSTINQILKGKRLETRVNRARALAIYKEILELKNNSATKFKLSDIHRAVNSLEIDKPRLTSYNKFEEFINRGPGRSFDELINYLTDKPRGSGNTKVGDGLKLLIYAFYADPRKLNFQRIAEVTSHAVREEVKRGGIEAAIRKWHLPDTLKVREQLSNDEDYVSSATVKKLITPEVKNAYYRKRYGLKEFRQNHVTPIFRRRAEYPLDRVEFDSTVFSFLFYDNNSRKYSIRLTTCIVVDSYSGRILGYAFAKSESAGLILATLRNTFSNIGSLPAEIFTDRFPGYNNEEIKHFFEQLKSLGCSVTFERTGNARAKGLVEVTINNVCELAKELELFAGKNITTKSIDSRKSVEAMAKMMRADQRTSIEEVKGMIIELFAFYNSRTPNGRELTRSDAFFNSKSFANAINLSIERQVWLFYKVAIKQVNQSCITFRKGYDRFVYPINDHLTRLRLNGQTVRVRYRDEDLTSKNEIWLFNIETDELICTCSQQESPMVASVNKTEADQENYKGNTKKNKDYTSFIKAKELEIDPLSVQVSNYLISDKIDQTKIEELHILQNMLEDKREAKMSMAVVELDENKLLVTGPFGDRIFKAGEEISIEPDESYDRLSGYDKDDVIEAEVEPIMIVNNRKMKNG